MPNEIDKQRVQQRFSRSLETYAEAATVQSDMAQQLLGALMNASSGQRCFHRIAEAGCGTGLLTNLLEQQLQFSQLYLLELVPECERFHRQRAHATFIAGDLEQVELPCQLDLFIANAVLQWMRDVPALLRRLAEALNPGAYLAFTTFGPDNLCEIRALTGAGLDYPTSQQWQRLLAPHFTVLSTQDTHVQLAFDTPLEVLRHLKQTGVTATAQVNATPWNRQRLASFATQYKRAFQQPDGTVSLTYHPLTFIARKPSSPGCSI